MKEQQPETLGSNHSLFNTNPEYDNPENIRVIFDYGGVIGVSSKDEVVARIANDIGMDPNEVRQVIFENTIKMQKVSVSEEDLWKGISRGLKINNLDNLKHFWIETIKDTSKIDLDMLAFLEDLSGHYKLYLLSNSTQLYVYSPFRRVLNRVFSEEIYSCNTGFRKPEKKIYNLTLAKLHAQPEECVIIDDEPENLVYPLSIGMDAVLYKNLSDLRSSLSKKLVLK